MLRMTEAAADFAAEIVAATGCAPCIRVRVIGGGCQGLTWDVLMGDESRRGGDRRRRSGDLDVVVDGLSAPHVDGATIDVAEPGASGLRPPIRGRPRPLEFCLTGLPAKQVCSCGESFSP